MTLPEARSFLGRFGISGQAQTSIMETLSDGQKSRVVLAKMAKESPHMLFLDAPTNHLDMESIDSLAKAINQFQGGMVLVSHDTRLISQVAKEIWMCDNKCVTRFTGEISDFKMHLRKQMQKDNILEGGSGGNTKADNSLDYSKMFVPLTPLTALSVTLETAPKGHMTVAPPAPPSMDLEKANKEREEMIRKEEEKKRKEDEERSIAAAAKSGETVEDDTTVTTSATESTEVEPDWDSMTEKEKEKALKAKRRKAEKEAKQALQKKQEEEVEIRRLQKIKDNEEARQLKIDQEAKMEEFRAEKAAREAKEAAIEAERLRAEEEELARRKEELKEKKRREKERRLQAEAIALQRAEEEVLADVWTQAQQLAFETVVLDNGPEVIQDRGRRWDIISAAVTKAGDGHKTRNQCVARYAYLKRHVREMKRAQISKE
jgi:energy-coupling factor transporter ATP-binding protein EcfA2